MRFKGEFCIPNQTKKISFFYNILWSNTWIWQPADNLAIRHWFVILWIESWPGIATNQHSSRMVIYCISNHMLHCQIYTDIRHAPKVNILWCDGWICRQYNIGLLCHKSKVPPVLRQTCNTVEWPNMMHYCWVCSKQLLSYEFLGSILLWRLDLKIMKAFFELFM